MPDRLSALDASFLYLEQPTTPMHVGGVAVFRLPRTGFEFDSLVELIEHRLALVPRFRQKIKQVPGRVARPVWVDDADFDIGYHVRRAALPKSGTDKQLYDLVARLMARPLDRSRPLWELYVIEGLGKSRFAIITKTHFAMVDTISAMDVAQVLLDVTPTPRETPSDLWMPRPEPGALRLMLDAATEASQRPAEIVENVRAAALDAAATARKVTSVFGGMFAAARSAMWAAPGSPLNVPISTQRRFTVARGSLDDFKRVRKAHGGTINDGVLAVVSGALRNWLLSRGEAVTSSTTIRALTPMSVRGPSDERPGDVSANLVELPVGEPNPVVRLHHVSHAMRAHADSGRSVGASTLVRLGGFTPPTLHALGARVANGFAQRIYNLVVTNVPGPQFPLYAAGARLLEIFPVLPLAKNQGLSIAVNSYDGGVYFGLNADRDAVADVDVLAGLITESLEELAGTVPRPP